VPHKDFSSLLQSTVRVEPSLPKASILMIEDVNNFVFVKNIGKKQ